MSNGMKAIMVTTGLFGFFFVAIAGPGLEFAGDTVVRTVLGHNAESELENKKRRDMKKKDGAKLSTRSEYSSEGDLGRASHCCQSCNRDWNHETDQCDGLSQQSATCFRECGTCLVMPTTESVAACCLTSTAKGSVAENGQCAFSEKTDVAGQERARFNACMGDICAKRGIQMSSMENP